MRYRVYNIEWDWSASQGGVPEDQLPPTEMFVDVDDDDEIPEAIGDMISDLSGFCYFGFKYEEEKET